MKQDLIEQIVEKQEEIDECKKKIKAAQYVILTLNNRLKTMEGDRNEEKKKAN